MGDQNDQSAWHKIGENRLKLVFRAGERMKALTDLIEKAETSLHIFYYMFEEDQIGQSVMDSLIAARERGVEVELLVDSFGSNGASDAFFKKLQRAGGKFAKFSPRFSTSYFVRNHQKMIIADEKKLLIGGFNIADQYFNRHSNDLERDRNPNSWEDMGLILEGPETKRLMDYYRQLSDWVHNDNGQLRSLRKMVKKWDAGSGTFRWLVGGPSNRLSRWAVSIKRDLERGKRLDLVTAYFSPGQSVVRRIGKLSKKGGKSRLMLAGRTDNAATIGASRLLYGYLLRRDVKIYEYQPKRLHMKLVIVDDAVYVGSANFDLRSLFINMELMLRIEDQEFASEARKIVDTLQADAEQITEKKHGERKSWLNRLRWIASYIVVSAIDYTVTRPLNFGLGKKSNLLPEED